MCIFCTVVIWGRHARFGHALPCSDSRLYFEMGTMETFIVVMQELMKIHDEVALTSQNPKGTAPITI